MTSTFWITAAKTAVPLLIFGLAALCNARSVDRYGSRELPEIVLKVKSGFSATLLSAKASRPIKAIYPGGWAVLSARSVEDAVVSSKWLKTQPGVLAADVNRRVDAVTTSFTPNDPYYPADVPTHYGQWHLSNPGLWGGSFIDARLPGAWIYNFTGQGVIIGIVDDGMEIDHEDLAPNYTSTNSYDFGQLDSNPSHAAAAEGHGTSVAGVAAARGGNGIGGTGAAPFAALGGLRLDFTSLNEAAVVSAIEFRSIQSQGLHIDIKNHSWGLTNPYAPLPLVKASLALVANDGSINVAAAGNWRTGDNSDSTRLEIQNSPHTITVGAIGSLGTHSNYSNYGSCLTACAPSSGPGPLGAISEILTTDRTGESGGNSSTDTDPFADLNYRSTFGGTSSASPLVAGVLALVKQAQPLLNTRFAKHLLARYSDLVDQYDNDLESDGGWQTNTAGYKFNPSYGFGLINASNLTFRATGYLGVSPLWTTYSGTQNVNAAIPDATNNGILGTPLTRLFNISSSDPLEEVELYLNITHAKRGHIEAYLTSPTGTKHRVVSRQSLITTPDIDWTFTANGFWGENPNGTWRLDVYDLYTGTTGTLNTFSLNCRQGRLLTPHGLNLAPNPVVGGQSVQGTATLSTASPAGGTLVALRYEGPISGPTSVTIPAGSTNAVFGITTTTVAAATDAWVIAEVNHAEVYKKLNVRRATVDAVSVSPDPVPNGSNATGTVTLNGSVTSNVTVALEYSPSAKFALAPSTVVVPAGQSQASFVFRSEVYDPGFAGTITARLNNSSATADFTVAPVYLTGANIYPFSAFTGQRVFGVARLARIRGVDTSVSITSSNPALLANRTVTIPAGETYAVFNDILGAGPSLDRFSTVTLTSSAGNEVRTDTFIVRPPTNAFASGYNRYYTVGDGLTRNRESFCAIDIPENFRQVVVSASTSMMLRADGNVWSVGQGTFGQHGDGSSGVGSIKVTPSQVPGISGVSYISSCAPTVLAVTTAGEVWAWGQNNVGQGGQAGGGNILVPTKVNGLTDIVMAASGAFASFALDGSGNIWSWGSNSNGANGRPSSGHVPIKIPGAVGPFVYIASGNQHAFAIHADGSLYGWGLNTSGQLGDGTVVNRLTPTLLPTEAHTRQVAGGAEHSILLRVPPFGANRSVRTTGKNTYGQRGDGTAAAAANISSLWASIASGANITEVAAGNKHSFYIGSASLRSWGSGANGERADGTFTSAKISPAPLPETVSAANILAGSSNSIALAAVRSPGRGEMLAINAAARTLQSVSFRTGAVTPLTGTFPTGHTVVGGGDIGGSTAVNEVMTMDGSRALFFQSVSSNNLGSSVSMGITLAPAETVAFVANMDGQSRMDIVTSNSSTGLIQARLWNGSSQTGAYALYTLAAQESLVGVGDMNFDGHQDLVIFNSVTRTLMVKLFKQGVLQGTATFTNAPLTPTVPASIPAVSAGLTPVAAAETKNGYGYELVFLTGAGTLEVWDMSRLNRVATGLAGPVIPASHVYGPFWR